MSVKAMPCATPARAAVRAPSSSSTFMGFTMPQQRLRLAAPRPARQVTRMGLFGLGVPELAVIAGVVALIYGKHHDQALAGKFPSPSTHDRLILPAPPPLPLPSAGPSKLPELGKGLGKTMKSFQSAAKVRCL